MFAHDAGDRLLEWNGVPLNGLGASDVQAIVCEPADEIEIVLRDVECASPEHSRPPYLAAARSRASIAGLHTH